jgi:hypothetical protein
MCLSDNITDRMVLRLSDLTDLHGRGVNFYPAMTRFRPYQYIRSVFARPKMQ